MKKTILILFVISLLVLSLTSCSLFGTEKPNEGITDNKEGVTQTDDTKKSNDGDDVHNTVPVDNAAEAALVEQGFEKVEKTETKERTVEELLQALKDGEPMKDSSGADYSAMPQTFSTDLTEAAQLQGTTIQFSEEPWETDKTVEEFDMEAFTAEMTPEEKAEWDEMMSKTEEDWAAEIAAMEAEMEEMTNSMNSSGGDDTYDTGDLGDIDDVEMPDMDEIQKQIDEALKQAQEQLGDIEFPEGYDVQIPGNIDIGSILGGY